MWIRSGKAVRKRITVDWDLIVERASYPFERLDTSRFLPAMEVASGLTERRLDRWNENLSVSGAFGLERRLAWDGFALADACSAVGAVRLAKNAPLPSWVDTLRSIVECAMRDSGLSCYSGPSHSIPFEEIFAAPVAVARAELERRLVESPSIPPESRRAIFDDRALLDLELDLTRRLAHLAGRALEARLDTMRPFGTRVAARVASSSTEFSRVHYERFVAAEIASGLTDLFTDLPALARLIAETVADWIECSVEFIRRLSADIQAIAEMFEPSGVTLGPVVNADSLRSDPHESGRTVVLLRFASGLRLVYKPRPVSIASAFNNLMRWCAARGATMLPPTMRVLDRVQYGWAAYLEQTPCANREEAALYFERVGSLLAILYLLDTTDCHHENVIATSEGLVLIDAETLLHPDLAQFVDPQALALEEEDRDRMTHSVLRTGLLPQWEYSRELGVGQDISGLGGGSRRSTIRVSNWRHVNTDGMVFVDEQIELPLEHNVTRLDGVVLSASGYRQEITKGFERMYRFFVEHRASIASGPLMNFSELPNRFVFRGTKVYVAVLAEALRPECLGDGSDFWIELERLGKAFLASDDLPAVWPMYRAELEAMARANVPLFRTNTSSDQVYLGETARVGSFLVSSSLERAQTKLRELDEKDLAFQTELLIGTLIAADARMVESRVQHCLPPVGSQLSPDACTQAAVEIADELLEQALVSSNSSLNWLGLSYDPLMNRYQMELTEDQLYDGRAGIAVFLAAAHQVTGDKRYRRGALAAVVSIRRQLESIDSEGWRRMFAFGCLGAAFGASSVGYGLLRVGAALEDSGLGELVRQFIRNLPIASLATKEGVDVLSGRAGLILVLLCAYTELGEVEALSKACVLGEQLLATRESVGGAPRAWRQPGMPQLAGFSHGAAGITLALARLHKVTGDTRFREAALEGIAFENTLWSSAENNWLDLRPDFLASNQTDGTRASSIQWCNGAPGIALARLGLQRCLDFDSVIQDIERGVETTAAYGVGGPDHLCCGTMGRVETLLVAGALLGREHYTERARSFASWVVARARSSGGYRIFANAPVGVTSPGFFSGTAGIGYQLLRLAHPELPSVLMFE